MKKSFAILMCLGLFLLLPACDGNVNKPVPPQPNPPALTEEPTALDDSEIKDFFQQTEAQIRGQYGVPPEENVYDLFGEEARDLIYENGNVFSVMNTADQSGTVFHGVIKDKDIAGPRAIQVGESLDSVLLRFPDESGGVRSQDDQDPEREYCVIYGEYVHMSTFGLLEYEKGEPILLTLSDEDLAVVLHISDSKIASIEYVVAMD